MPDILTFALGRETRIATPKALPDSYAFELSREAVLHITPHVSRDVNRQTLNHLYLDPAGHVVATTGQTLGVWRDGHSCPVPMLIKTDWKAVSKLKSKRFPFLPLTVTVEKERVIISMEGAAMSVIGTIGDPPYPDWYAVVPMEQPSDKPTPNIRFNLELLERFKYTSHLGLTLRITTQEKCIVVQKVEPEFYGLLMPLRRDETPRDLSPSWLRAPAAPAAKPKKARKPKATPAPDGGAA